MKYSNEPIGWKSCPGAAHSNPYIDNCAICMPYWETYPVCPRCGRKLRETRDKRVVCDECQISFELTIGKDQPK